MLHQHLITFRDAFSSTFAFKEHQMTTKGACCCITTLTLWFFKNSGKHGGFNICKTQRSQPFQPGTVPVMLKCWIVFKYHTILYFCNPINIYRFQNDIPRQWYPLSSGRKAEKCNNHWLWFSPLKPYRSLFPHMKVIVNITFVLMLSNQKAQQYVSQRRSKHNLYIPSSIFRRDAALN